MEEVTTGALKQISGRDVLGALLVLALMAFAWLLVRHLRRQDEHAQALAGFTTASEKRCDGCRAAHAAELARLTDERISEVRADSDRYLAAIRTLDETARATRETLEDLIDAQGHGRSDPPSGRRRRRDGE